MSDSFQRCDACDPSYGCFDGSSPCSKAPILLLAAAIKVRCVDGSHTYGRLVSGQVYDARPSEIDGPYYFIVDADGCTGEWAKTRFQVIDKDAN